LAMEEVFDQYGKVSKNEKIKMILNIVLQNRMSM
jgi:hypothetical protein